jgi:hypothetical protein
MHHLCRFHFQRATAEVHKCGPSYNPGVTLMRLQDDGIYASTRVEDGVKSVCVLERYSQNRPTFHIKEGGDF